MNAYVSITISPVDPYGGVTVSVKGREIGNVTKLADYPELEGKLYCPVFFTRGGHQSFIGMNFAQLEDAAEALVTYARTHKGLR